MLDLIRQSRDREEAERKSQELREQRQILLDPQSVGPQVIWYHDLQTLCVMCQAPRALRCKRCLPIWYCSERCQQLDWPAHKLLCAWYPKFVSARISEHHRLGIWFPRDTTRPRLIWAPSYSQEFGFHYLHFDPYLGRNNGLLFTIPFAVNKQRGLDLDYWLTIWYCDYGEITNKSVLAAVEACHGMIVPCPMLGDYVVMSGQRGSYTGTLDHEFVDVTLADFRHTLDWSSTYFDTTSREILSRGCVYAVEVSSPREQMIYGRELFTSVAVDRDFPSNSDISPISQALGLPIRVLSWIRMILRELSKQVTRNLGRERGGRTPKPEL
ncbi:hypothetical protein BDV06DRAFT_228987 [Aspergillus oleicola]